jgi:hypothetical protein
MPAETDWSPLLTKLGVPKIVPSTDGKGTYTVSDNDAIKLALQVVQAVFPDYTQRVTPKISSDTPKDWKSIAEYTPLTGSIAFDPRKMAGQWAPSTSVKQIPGKSPEAQINFNTDEVLTNVNTFLHELYHARSVGGWNAPNRMKAEKQFGITDEMKRDINKLAASDAFGVGNLYSMKADYLDTEEFMANAASLLDMRDRSVIPEKGPLREKLHTVEAIIQKYPQMGQFIENQRQPDIPSLQSGAPEPGTLGALIETVFGGPRTTRPGESK